MNMKEIGTAVEKVGSVSITTLDGSTMHSRIISICGSDAGGLYFLTMNVKPFYRQLQKNPQVALCGIYPSGRKEGKNKDGQPYWPPGFFLRITGEAQEVPVDEMREKAPASEVHRYALEEVERYSATTLFCIHRGKGELFDYDFELENRDHKLLRKRFAFGGESANPSGVRIDPDRCVSCGECHVVCSFDAIVEGEPYRVVGERCDECGSCVSSCPVEAIELSKTM